MTLIDLEHMFTRSLKHAFELKKFLFLGLVLALSGLLVVFCQGFAFHEGLWGKLSLTFFPLFLSTGLLFAAGVVAVRSYQHEKKQLHFSYLRLFKEGHEMIMHSLLLTLPFLLAFLVLWIFLGVFLLFKEIPVIGSFFGAILSFGPFLLIFGAFVLLFIAFISLFFITPLLALKNQWGIKEILQASYEKMRQGWFHHLFLFLIGCFPLLLLCVVLGLSYHFTFSLYLVAKTSLEATIQNFFIMLSIVALITPFVAFFFNFSAEAHTWILSQFYSSKPKDQG